MARYTATEARKHFSSLLDAAERGEEVVLEHNGIRFKLVLEGISHAEEIEPILIVTDPDVLNGAWTWVSDEDGQLQFQPRSLLT